VTAAPREPVVAATPELSFAVTGAAAIEYAAVPTVGFTLAIASENAVAVQAISLNAQVRIAPAGRSYDPVSQARLVELFGAPDRWATNLHGFLWAHSTLPVGPFTAQTEVTLPVPCTYDFEVAVAKYFNGVQDGQIPLEFLFSGNVFYRGADGMLQTCRLSWEKEAAYQFPVRVWREMMDHYFPDTAWIRFGKAQFDRLYAYRCTHSLLSWDDAIDALLRSAGPER